MKYDAILNCTANPILTTPENGAIWQAGTQTLPIPPP
jgi:hypothetical protein